MDWQKLLQSPKRTMKAVLVESIIGFWCWLNWQEIAIYWHSLMCLSIRSLVRSTDLALAWLLRVAELTWANRPPKLSSDLKNGLQMKSWLIIHSLFICSSEILARWREVVSNLKLLVVFRKNYFCSTQFFANILISNGFNGIAFKILVV